MSVPTVPPPTDEQAFRSRCRANAVTDPEVVARLWAEEVARRTGGRDKSAKGGRKGRR